MIVPLLFIVLFGFLGASMMPLALGLLAQALSDRRGKRLSRWAIGLGLASVYKPALTFTNSNELTLKRRSYDEDHDVEYISFGGTLSGVKRYLLERDDRYHDFYGVPFAFVDELFGVPVDPRDVDVGHCLGKDRDHNRYENRVETDGGYIESVKAIFERPRGHIGVRLPEVATLYGGSIDSKGLERIRDYYETSQAPKSETTAMRQLLVPVGAVLGVVLMGFFISGGASAPDAATPSSSNGSDINVGLLLLALSLQSIVDTVKPYVERVGKRRLALGGGVGLAVVLVAIVAVVVSPLVAGVSVIATLGLAGGWMLREDINWRDAIVGTLVLGVGGLMTAVMLLAFGAPVQLLGMALPLGVWCLLGFGLGAALPPFVAQWFGRSLGPIGMGLGKLFITVGLLRFTRPVIDFDGGQYHVVEYDPDEFPVTPHWYRFAFSKIGIAYRNTRENWPDGTTLTKADIDAMLEGGSPEYAPTGHVRTTAIQTGDIEAHVPVDPVEDANYVRTDRTTGWLVEAGMNRRLLRTAIERAKQDFGGGDKPVSDKWVMAATLVGVGMGMAFNVVVFF